MNSIDNEHWKDIDGYDGLYQVSDLGRVRSLKFGKTRIRRPRIDRYGYLQVGLCKDGKETKFRVHRLVANAFIPNNNILNDQVNHKDENKQNNRASNLEWCDRYYNMHYNGLYKRRKRRKQYFPPNYKRDKVKDLYNPNLTYKQNLELFMANGIDCSTVTLWRIRQDLGLIK